MLTKIKHLSFTVSLLFIFLCCSSTQAQSQKDIMDFVNGVLADLNSSSIKVPAFESAQAQSAQKIKQANGIGYYLCKLRNKEGPAGYVAVAAEADTYQVIALSATDASPEYFLKQLQVRNLGKQPLRFSQAKLVSFVKDVPLVASAKTQLGTEPIEISEIASCLSCLFNHMQYEQSMPLFGGATYKDWDSRYLRLYRSNVPEQQVKGLTRRSFAEEYREVTSNKKITPKMTFNEKARLRVEQRNTVKPIIRRRLLDPTSPLERHAILQRETNMIDSVTLMDISKGMQDAILLQEDYLNQKSGNLAQDISLFFRTRGVTASPAIMSFNKIPDNSLPAILIGPENVCGLLLGYIDIAGTRFASVFFPKTSKPNTMTMAERKRAIRIERGLPPEQNYLESKELQEAMEELKESERKLREVYKEKGLPDPTPQKTVEERAREWEKQAQAAEEKMIIVEDLKSARIESMQTGIHIIRCDSLASWQVLNINKVQIGNNWGIPQSK